MVKHLFTIPLFFVLVSATILSCGDMMDGENEYAPDTGAALPEGADADSAAYPDEPQAVPDSEPAEIQENPFVDVTEQPVSTFSIDVDTAAYSLVRRYIMQQNMLPPKGYVRIEEMINYFSYDYPNPTEEYVPFSLIMEMAASPWNSETEIIMLGIKGKELRQATLPDSTLVFLIDVSGSMSSPDKLPLLQKGFMMLVDHLKPTDTVAIVTYAGQAGVALSATSGSEKEKIKEVIQSLTAAGSTAGAAGITTAYEIAQQHFLPEGNNRVILATDGDFNVGIYDNDELEKLIVEKREAGVFLTTIGFGIDNIQDRRLEMLANKGNGNYFYIDNEREAKKVFVDNLRGNLFTIAKDVKIQVEFHADVIEKYRLIGYENRMLKNQDFNDDTKDAGEIGAGHTVTAFYEVYRRKNPLPIQFTPPEQEDFPAAEFARNDVMQLRMRYKEPDEDESNYLSTNLNDTHYRNELSENMAFSSSVVEFGMLLRDSAYKGASSYDAVLERARTSLGSDVWGFRGEFLEIVDKAKSLSSH